MGYPARKDLLAYRGDDSKWPMQIRRAQEYSDGTVTSGSTTVTSATAEFTSDDVGGRILIHDLNLRTTIVTVTSATEVEVATAPTETLTGTRIYVWRPLDLTGYTLAAVGRAAESLTSPIVVTFTVTITTALEGRIDLLLPKEQSVLMEERLYWDLQTVDTTNGDWTETILAGALRPGGQVTG